MFRHFQDDAVWRQTRATVLAQHLAQCLVATARFIVLQTPIGAIQAGVNDGVDVPVVKAGLHAGGLKLGQQFFGRHH